MNSHESLFPLRPFKDIRKLYNAMVGGNYVTLIYKTDTGLREFSGFVADVGTEQFNIVDDLAAMQNVQFMTYAHLLKISVGYVLQHGQRTILSALTAEREKLMNRLFDDMLVNECLDIYTAEENYDTELIYSISLTGITLTGNMAFIPFSKIIMTSPCRKYGEKD